MSDSRELTGARDSAAGIARRKLDALRLAINAAEDEISKGIGGGAMRADFCVPSSQAIQEAVVACATFVAYWRASGMIGAGS